MKFHCLFEQSGTFKNEFKKLGYDAEDYDILNGFGETDHIIDLYDEIDKAYERERESIFDKFTPEDTILAFFPCIRFENQIGLLFRGKQSSQKKWSEKKKIIYDMKLHSELHNMYLLFSKLVIICLDKNIPLIIENPYSSQHYLTRYWCVEPTIIDYNRRETGDYFKKPTQYWFFNLKPKNNFIFESTNVKEKKRIDYMPKGISRSLISSDYANRFIREFIIDSQE